MLKKKEEKFHMRKQFFIDALYCCYMLTKHGSYNVERASLHTVLIFLKSSKFGPLIFQWLWSHGFDPNWSNEAEGNQLGIDQFFVRLSYAKISPCLIQRCNWFSRYLLEIWEPGKQVWFWDLSKDNFSTTRFIFS